jgi:ubiquinone/menaquinone biosynthesis C-methylase UbiE
VSEVESQEAERIRSVYEREYSDDGRNWSARWSPRNLTAAFYRQLTERALISALNEAEQDLAEKDILDVGCGAAPHLRFFAEIGADRQRLHGIDLVPERIAGGKRLGPDLDLAVADATNLPFEDDSFDVVSQFTALCNITDDAVLAQAALEMRRVLRSSGHVIWFDIQRVRSEAHYRAIERERLRSLFPGFEVLAEREIFNDWTPYFASRLPELALALERMPFRKTNLLAILRRSGAST